MCHVRRGGGGDVKDKSWSQHRKRHVGNGTNKVAPAGRLFKERSS